MVTLFIPSLQNCHDSRDAIALDDNRCSTEGTGLGGAKRVRVTVTDENILVDGWKTNAWRTVIPH